MRFSGRVGLLPDWTFWKQKVDSRGRVCGKSKDCFRMKKLTYLEEFFVRKSAIFFAMMIFTITIETTHGL